MNHGPAKLSVSLSVMAANYRTVRGLAAPAAVAPVVKADSYGTGMEKTAASLARAGADTFFVARMSEGISLRAVLPRARIFVFDGVAPGTAPTLNAYRLTPVLNALEEIAEWQALSQSLRSTLDAAIQVDTGMNRSGLSRSEVTQLAANARSLLSGLNLSLIMSHLACADDPKHKQNREQLERFRSALAMLPPAPASLAATSGISLGRDYVFDIVRPGIGLYGGNPNVAEVNPYRMAVNLSGEVLQVRRVDEGESIGYGAAFTTAQNSILVTVASGYADGLIRAAGPKAKAMLGGVPVSFAGRISMDLVMLDATHVPVEKLYRGASVEFLNDMLTLDDMAKAAGTIAHEVLTSVHPRVKRIYADD